MSQPNRSHIGPYRVELLLGRGGMGEVWRARHPSLNRRVAVKLIRADRVSLPEVAEAFMQEVDALSPLRAPQTVQVMDFGLTDAGEPYFVTEYLDGENLQSLLDREGRVPPELALFFAIEVLKSLAEAHAYGIVHRDLKPPNVFLQNVRGINGRMVVKVLDFGLAERMVRRGEARATPFLGAGSPGYVSPEQIDRLPATPQSDLYAVGMLLFQMLSGHLPYTGTTDTILRQTLEAPIPRLSQHIRRAIPRSLDVLVRQCLAKNPMRRPYSAEVLLRQLEEVSGQLTPRNEPEYSFGGSAEEKWAEITQLSERPEGHQSSRPLLPPLPGRASMPPLPGRSTPARIASPSAVTAENPALQGTAAPAIPLLQPWAEPPGELPPVPPVVQLNLTVPDLLRPACAGDPEEDSDSDEGSTLT